MKDKIKTVSKTINVITDTKTGEIVDSQIKKIQIVTNSDDFSLIYSEFWNILMNKP